jgi:pheromone shutdown protein TraB
MELPAAPLAGVLGRTLTGAFGRLQDRAGKAAGVLPGAAWRAALQAATEVGAQQLLLGDRPAPISERRLAAEVASMAGAAVVGALALLVAGVWAAASPAFLEALVTSTGADSGVLHMVVGTPVISAATLALCLVGSGGMLWPVLGPLVEVWRFSQLSGPEVEAAVALPEPIQEGADVSRPLKLWGEDALLDWPGAWQRLIVERDTYMADVLAAAALGLPSGAPAMIATDDCGPLLWRFMAAQRAPAAASPAGLGDAEYAPLPAPHALVAVVGSAHVRGICHQWGNALQRTQQAGSAQLDDLLRP